MSDKYAVTDELLDHDYDGIREYDNPLPRWWLYMFYITIAFAIAYVGYFILGPGPDSRTEYEMEMAAAAVMYPDEDPASNIELLTAALGNPKFIGEGKGIFATNCAACHGPDGGGIVGPNLTDDFWLHGKGDIAGVVRVVADGVPEKGMIAWKKQLKVKEMVAVSAYIMSLRGTTPANPKAPQGEKMPRQAAN
ncbi:MAG: cbb3-type cytochrome c oxidase N-terminal domain-containing protein [Bradymonadia bacterium]